MTSARSTRRSEDLWDPSTTLCIYLYQCRCTGVTKRGSRCMNRVNKDDIQTAASLLRDMARLPPNQGIPSKMLRHLARLTLCLRWHRTDAQANHLVYSWRLMIDDYCAEIEEEESASRQERTRASRNNPRNLTNPQDTTTARESGVARGLHEPATQSPRSRRSDRTHPASSQPPIIRSKASHSATRASTRPSQLHNEGLSRKSSSRADEPLHSVRRAQRRLRRPSVSTTDESSDSESSSDSNESSDTDSDSDETSDSEEVSGSDISSDAEDSSHSAFAESDASSYSNVSSESNDSLEPDTVSDADRGPSISSSIALATSQPIDNVAPINELPAPASTPGSLAIDAITTGTSTTSITIPAPTPAPPTAGELQLPTIPISPQVHRPGLRQPLTPNSTCPVCFEAITAPATATYCRAQCGGNLHKYCFIEWRDECFKKFEAEQGIAEGDVLSPMQRVLKFHCVTCVYCRTRWEWDLAELVYLGWVPVW